jgi:hypothetical protein
LPDHYRLALPQSWKNLVPRFSAAQSAEEIVTAISEDAIGMAASLAPFSELILKIMGAPKFPREVQIADSLLA